MHKSITWLKYIVISSIVVSLVTPLLLKTTFFFPFVSSKVFVFRTFVEVGFAAYILLALLAPSFRPKRDPMTVIFGIYVVVLSIAAALGVNPYKSFWGTVERGEGILLIWHVYALYLMVRGVLTTRAAWKQVFGLVFGVSTLVSLYGLGQLFGSEGVINTTGERLSSTIGNASFLAGYLMMNIFVGLALIYMRMRHNLFVWLVGVGMVLNLIVMLQTQTRGALLGFVVGLVVLSLFFVRCETRTVLKRTWYGVLLGVVLVVSLVGLFRERAFIQENRILHRFANISLTDITTQSRLLAWETSYQAFTERPMFGWGHENYNIAFDRYFPTPIYRDSGSQIWFDRAHNVLFDHLTMHGIVGFVAYLALLCVAAKLIHKLWRDGGDKRFVGSVFGALLVAYLAQNLFVFDVLPTYILLVLVFGYLSWQTSDDTPDSNRDSGVSSATGAVSGVVIVAALLLAIYHVNILPAKANLEGAEGIRAFGDGDLNTSFALLDASSERRTYQSGDLKLQFSNKAVQRKEELRADPKTGALVLSRAQAYAKEIQEKEPLNSRYYLLEMAVNNAARGVFDTPLEDMERLAERALEYSPTRPHIYYELAQAYLNHERFDDALSTLEKARTLSPGVGVVYRNLMLAHSQQGDWEAVREILHNLIVGDSDVVLVSDDYDFIIQLLGAGERYEDLITFYEWLLMHGRSSGEDYAQLAALYAIVERFDDARAAVRKAVELDFTLEGEARTFLQVLNEKEAAKGAE